MTFNLLLIGRESVMIGISIVCAFLIAAMMIPRAIRHRKQIREQQGDKDPAYIIGDPDNSSSECNDQSIENDNHSSQ